MVLPIQIVADYPDMIEEYTSMKDLVEELEFDNKRQLETENANLNTISSLKVDLH